MQDECGSVGPESLEKDREKCEGTFLERLKQVLLQNKQSFPIWKGYSETDHSPDHFQLGLLSIIMQLSHFHSLFAVYS